MEQKTQQLLTNPDIMPTDKIIFDCLGTTGKFYKTLISELENNHIFLMEWRYYNDGKAWLSKGEYHWVTTRGTDKIKPIFWVSIWNGFFKISFSFSEKTKDKLLNLSLSEKTKEQIRTVQPNGTKMRFIPVIFNVIEESVLSDILLLANFRKENL